MSFILETTPWGSPRIDLFGIVLGCLTLSGCGGLVRLEEDDLPGVEHETTGAVADSTGASQGSAPGMIWSDETIETPVECACDREQDYFLSIYDVRRNQVLDYHTGPDDREQSKACASGLPQIILQGCGTFELLACNEANDCAAFKYLGEHMNLTLASGNGETLSSLSAVADSLEIEAVESLVSGSAVLLDHEEPVYELTFNACSVQLEPSCR